MSVASGAELEYPVQVKPAPLSRFFPSIQARYERWWGRKIKPVDSYEFGYRTVFVLPTKPGLMLAVTLLVLLVAAINYELNLGYMLTFSLAGSGVVAMFMSCTTLWGLTVRLGRVRPAHVGEEATVEIQLLNASKRWRYGIEVGYAVSKDRVPADVEPGAQHTLRLTWEPKARGLQPLPMLAVESAYPMGVTRAWGHWRPSTKVLVYPKPELNAPQIPLSGAATTDGARSTRSGAEDFEGMRPYQHGDSLKLISWKRSQVYFATGAGGIVSKDYSTPNSSQLAISIDDVKALDVERGLSRLAAWVLRAHEEGATYSLDLRRQRIEPGSGKAHLDRCLEALARY